MKITESWLEMLPGLRRAGADQAELYVKRGRSRRYERRPWVRRNQLSRETGWAVRGSGREGSFLLAGSGQPSPPAAWPSPSGRPIELPRGSRVPAWKATADLDAPLVSEVEAGALLDRLEAGLRREVDDARLSMAVIEDGASESSLINSRGVEAGWRARGASLYLEVTAPGVSAVRLYAAESEARRLQIPALAQRLADRLLVARDGTKQPGGGDELILHPQVGVRVLAGLLPWLVGALASERLSGLGGSDGRVASELVSVIDNGRYPGGVLDAPVDGEGVPTEELILIDQGRYRQPLLDWRQARGEGEKGVGCGRRPSWRDWPAAGPTHLYLAPDPGVRPGDLLASVERGHYLLDVVGGGWFDPTSDRFSLPVCGFSLRSGEAPGALSRARLSGGLGDLLRSVRGVARDLTFVPLHGLLGVPTLLVSGFELQPD